MIIKINEIITRANLLIRRFGTRNPFELADALDVEVIRTPFKSQRGAYKVIMQQAFAFLKDDLPPVMENIVLLHELGHDQFHWKEAGAGVGFKEFEIFDMRDKRMEYEANIFAAHISLLDEDVLDCIASGYNVDQIAKTLNSDINLVALKVSEMNSRGYQFHMQEHKTDFLSARHM